MKTWKIRPLYTSIIEELEREGSLTDEELLKTLRQVYGDLTLSELNKALMKMEIEGMVQVSYLARGKRMVELVRREEPKWE